MNEASVIKTEKRISESPVFHSGKEMYCELIENSPFGFAVIDKFRFVYVNNVFSQILGCRAETLMKLPARKIKDLIYFKDREDAWGRIYDAIRNKKEFINILIRFEKNYGDLRWLELHISFRKHQNKTMIQLIAIDITEKKDSQEQLLHIQKMETMGQLTAEIAHQLNTPMAVISTRLQMLVDDLNRHGSTRYLDNVNNALEGVYDMTKIISRLVTFLRQSNGTRDTTDINQLLIVITGLLEDSAKKKNIKIGNWLSKKLPLIPANRNKLEQVFFDIIMNAFEAMPNGGQFKIRTRFLLKNTPRLEITFTDTGTGMPEKVKKKIFEPFFTTKIPNRGNGLGMFKSYCFIKEHKGEIVVKSKMGKGTQVSIFLPFFS